MCDRTRFWAPDGGESLSSSERGGAGLAGQLDWRIASGRVLLAPRRASTSLFLLAPGGHRLEIGRLLFLPEGREARLAKFPPDGAPVEEIQRWPAARRLKSGVSAA